MLLREALLLTTVPPTTKARKRELVNVKIVLLLLPLLLLLLLVRQSVAPFFAFLSIENGSGNLANCVWGAAQDERCTSPEYMGAYPNCSLFQYPSGEPIPCEGTKSSSCEFAGLFAGSSPPRPASWHLHVLFPNERCTNCAEGFNRERPGYSYAGAMQLRAAIARTLNNITSQLVTSQRAGRPPGRLPLETLDRGRGTSSPETWLDETRAGIDPNYDQCYRRFHIAPGAPANYHATPCAYAVDPLSYPNGPFTDPRTRRGYPNFAFFLPGDVWLPQLVPLLLAWLDSVVATHSPQRATFPLLLHPNTGCELRDHFDPASIRWLGTHSYPLNPAAFECAALGCNRACGGLQSPTPPPAECARADS